MIDQNYNNILEEVLKNGLWYDDPNRKNVKRLEIPSYTFRHEFKDGFPAISTKKLAWKSVVTELIWFLKGDTNIKYLIDNDCNIWNKDGYAFYEKCYEKYPLGKEKLSKKEWIEKQKKGYSKHSGDLGRIYGHYWRNFDGIDQIDELINNMINKPMSSELIVSARNPAHKDQQALPCCHYGFQIIMKPLELKDRLPYLNNEDRQKFGKVLKKALADDNYPGVHEIRHQYCDSLNIPKYGFELHWNQRSCDLFLGIPFNIASYALLALILEKITGHKALAIQGDLKKVHLYDNSIKAAKEQLSRKCSKEKVKLYEWIFNYISSKIDKTNIDEFVEMLKICRNEIVLENYNPQPAIKVEMLERR